MTPWYEWVFSGAGLFAVGAVGKAVYGRHVKKQDEKSRSLTPSTENHSLAVIESPGSLILAAPITDSPVAVGNNINQTIEVHHHHAGEVQKEEWTLTKPTQVEILREIKAALPFDQEHASQKYVRLNVVWKVSFSAISQHGAFFYVITTPFEEGKYIPTVNFVLSEVTPEIRSARQGSVFLVRGTIEQVDAITIRLERDPVLKLVKRD